MEGIWTPSNSWFFAPLSLQSKRNHDRFSRFRTVDRRTSLYCTMGASFPQNCPFPQGDLEPYVTHNSMGLSELITQTASRSVEPFLHRWPQGVPILYNGTPFPPQNCPFPWGHLNPQLVHGSLGPPESSIQTAYRSVQSFYRAPSVTYTDRLTDRPRYSVGNNRLHLCTYYGWCNLIIQTVVRHTLSAILDASISSCQNNY